MPSYIIKPGDTLSKIALQNGTTVAAIAAANGIKDANRIFAGASITIPQSSRSLSIGASTTPAQTPAPAVKGPNKVVLGNGTEVYVDQRGNIVDQKGATMSSEAISTAVEKHVNDIVDTIVGSGKIINPKITKEELDKIDPSTFLAQAEAAVSPSYREKFQVVKDSLTRDFTNLGYDLTKKVEDVKRTKERTIETGIEELAGRGLAFSGKRNSFETETADAATREIESANVTQQRAAQKLTSDAESKIGTEGVRALNLGSFGGKSSELSTTPLTGSLNSDQRYTTESMARELEKQERERRAYATRSLAFG